MKRIGIILGSTRQNRFGEIVAQWVLAEAQQVTTARFELLDMRDYPLPFYDEPKSPSALDGVYTNPVAQTWVDTVAATDAFIFITPEYNHSYPAVLKNAVDYMLHEWRNKAFAIISYSPGPIGGARAADDLRHLVSYMGGNCLAELNLTFARKYFDDTGHMTDSSMVERLHKVIGAVVD